MSRHPMLNVMKYYGNDNPTREEYINFVYAGTPPLDEDGNLPAELEAELPERFQRKEKVIHEEVKAAEDALRAKQDRERREVDAFITRLERLVEE